MNTPNAFQMLILNGSPHRAGSTMSLAGYLTKASGAVAETIHLYDEGPIPCRGCGKCESGVCVLDGVMAEILLKAEQSDCLVLASPLHFTSMTAPMIAFISRLQALWRAGRTMNRTRLRCGALVLTGGAEYENMFRPAQSVAAAAFNVLGIEFAGVLTAAGTDATPIHKNPRAPDDASALSERIRLCSDGS